MECYTYLRHVTDLLSDGKTPYERRFGEPFNGPISFGSLVEYYTIFAKDQLRIHQFGKKVLPGLILGYALYAGEFGSVTYWLQTLRSWKRWTHQKSSLKDSQCERGAISQRKWRIYFSSRRWTNQTFWRRSGTENTHLDTGTPNSRRRSHRFSWRIRRMLCKKAASMTIGISIDQEICLILGQVSLSLLC